ncbi:hypothetical protein Dimus_025815 [Dionaea muscipula]
MKGPTASILLVFVTLGRQTAPFQNRKLGSEPNHRPPTSPNTNTPTESIGARYSPDQDEDVVETMPAAEEITGEYGEVKWRSEGEVAVAAAAGDGGGASRPIDRRKLSC